MGGNSSQGDRAMLRSSDEQAKVSCTEAADAIAQPELNLPEDQVTRDAMIMCFKSQCRIRHGICNGIQWCMTFSFVFEQLCVRFAEGGPVPPCV